MLDGLRRIKVPGPPEHWQQFLACCMLHFVIPLLPFGVEAFADGRISPETLSVGAAVYVMAIGASSRNVGLFVIAITLSFFYTILFGLLLAHVPAAALRGPRLVWWSVGAIVLFHAIERFNRHVMERLPYLEFMRAGKPGTEE